MSEVGIIASKRFYSRIDGIAFIFTDGTKIYFKDKYADVTEQIHIDEIELSISKKNPQIFDQKEKDMLDKLNAQLPQNAATAMGITAPGAGGFTANELKKNEDTLKAAIQASPMNVQIAHPNAPIQALIPLVNPPVRR
jgi:hypothetical protein